MGCLVTPTRDFETNIPADCKLVTKKLKLKVIGDLNIVSGCDSPECVLILLTPGVVSGTVSSSIMILNNTVHWIEKEGRCDDGSIKNAIELFTNSIKKSGGWVVDSVDKLLEWLKIKDLKKKEKEENVNDVEK